MLASHGRFPYSAIGDRPPFEWPEARRLAVHVSINVEYFAYNEGTGLSFSPGIPQPNTYNWGWREYGIRVGIWRLLDLCKEFELPISALVNSSVIEHAPRIIGALQEYGAEFVGHGRTNSEHQNDFDEAAEVALIAEATAALTAATGTAPTGWLSPGVNPSAVTTDLLQEAGYRYLLDWPIDDQPVWMTTRNGGHILSVPYPQEINDIPFLVGHDGSAAQFAEAIIDNFGEMLRQSTGQSLAYGIALHTFLAGQPFRLAHLRRAFEQLAAQRDQVWFATTGQIAEHFATLHPVPRSPSSTT